MKKNSEIMSGSPPASPSKTLYLARDIMGGSLRYSLRQTYRDVKTDLLLHREIFDLGGSPQQFIIYLGDNGYCIDNRVTDTIEPYIAGDAAEMVEELLWPFVRRDIRAKLEPFMNRGSYKRLSPVTAAEKEAIDNEIHMFDRRRLHFLFYGAVDQSGLYRMPDKLCRRLLGKSRDEKEQYFIASEQVFYADQVKEYLFTIFNLQHHFNESFARIMPQALNQDQLDTFFVDELCRLSRDTIFWQGMDPAKGLQPYMIRYLIMFFDYDFSASQAINDYIRQFMNSHRQFRFPKKKSSMTTDKASEIFGEPVDKLTKLSKKELTKLYRKKAKELHPDTGGEHDEFVRLTEAFEQLQRQR
ncbi:MAG: J domain-containing protein [Proteobacteria bacterium]|nr:J domain-containing protein [Pseudomonadota bacterium]MBU4297716.1 J domain-containing protein [Pseudomonadota bacterium]MCG2749593.1 J domain-containing protein [Desulfobulbaceae bacterium]